MKSSPYQVAFLRLAFGWLISSTIHAAAAASAVPDFSLPRFESQQVIKRDDLAGGIVVLDFFAEWCPPCRASVPQIEQGIRQHYAALDGNAHGRSVHVIFVNTDQHSDKKTRAFIQRTGAGIVAEDAGGKLLAAFGGENLPFTVVLDGTRAQSQPDAWKVVHREAGFGGLPALRTIIDSIGQASEAPPQTAFTHASQFPVCRPGDTNCAAAGASVGENHEFAIGADYLETTFDGLWSSDIGLTETTLTYRRVKGDSRLDLGVAVSTFDVDYQNDPSTDPLGTPRNLKEERVGFAARYQHRLNRLTLGAGGSYYDGFTDYRNLWLSEYYRQQFDFFPSYQAPDPRGWGTQASARYEYLPASGFVELEGAYRRDHVAPGYELVFNPGPPPSTVLESGATLLETVSGRLRFENVLTPRLRSLVELQLSDTTDRELRYGAQGTLNYALSEHWVTRLNAGYTSERPELTAWWVGGMVERDWDNRWFVGLTARYYTDTGYLENSGLISDATPELATYHAALSLRWQGEQLGFRLSAGPYFSRYSGAGPGTLPFVYLYQDRDWFQAQAALSYKF